MSAEAATSATQSRISLPGQRRIGLNPADAHRPTRMGLTRQTRIGLTRQTRMGLTRQTRIGLTRQTRIGLTRQTRMGLTRQTRMGLTRQTRNREQPAATGRNRQQRAQGRGDGARRRVDPPAVHLVDEQLLILSSMRIFHHADESTRQPLTRQLHPRSRTPLKNLLL